MKLGTAAAEGVSTGVVQQRGATEGAGHRLQRSSGAHSNAEGLYKMGAVHHWPSVLGKAPEPGVVSLRMLEVIQAPEGGVVCCLGVALAKVVPPLLV